MAKTKPDVLTEGMIESLRALSNGAPITVAELKLANFAVNPSQLTALVKRGLVASESVSIEVPIITKRDVNQYTITEAGLAKLAELANADNDSDSI